MWHQKPDRLAMPGRLARKGPGTCTLVPARQAGPGWAGTPLPSSPLACVGGETACRWTWDPCCAGVHMPFLPAFSQRVCARLGGRVLRQASPETHFTCSLTFNPIH